MNCQDIREDIDLCALGTLEPGESERVRAHAARCDACRAALLAAEQAAAALALTVPRVRAPAAVRRSVMEAVRAEHDATPQTEPSVVPQAIPARTSHLRRLSIRYGALAAVLVVVPLAGLLVWAALLQHQVNDLRHDTEQMQRRNDGLLLFAVPSSVKADFRPVGNAKGATGAATWNPGRNVCFVLFDHLPQPEPGTAYRLWYLVDGGRRVVDAGDLTPDANGKAEIILDASQWRGQDYEMVLKLEQRPHDVAAPTLMVARLSRPD
jgi:hypothetical protein